MSLGAGKGGLAPASQPIIYPAPIRPTTDGNELENEKGRVQTAQRGIQEAASSVASVHTWPWGTMTPWAQASREALSDSLLSQPDTLSVLPCDQCPTQTGIPS